MSTVLTIYNQQSFCRQLLPSDNNVDYYFTLAGKKFCLKNNLQLHLEIINKAWRVLPGKDYLLFLENKDGVQALSSACPLKDGMRLLVQTPDMAQVRIRVRESEFLRPYQKVLFPSSGQIRIGTAPAGCACFRSSAGCVSFRTAAGYVCFRTAGGQSAGPPQQERRTDIP